MRIPVILLKSPSRPSDAYEERFTTSSAPVHFSPTFLPVFTSRFLPAGITQLRSLIQDGHLAPGPHQQYGGIIFTSQRAVEAFADILSTQSASAAIFPASLPLYVVGPATSRALHALDAVAATQIRGAHTGNGEALAHFILADYTAVADGTASPSCANDRAREPPPPSPPRRLPLLFPVSQQRRDVIPRTLQDTNLSAKNRIHVHELEVYGMQPADTFATDLTRVLDATAAEVPAVAGDDAIRWIVIFSPAGCESVLRALGHLDEKVSKDAARSTATSPSTATTRPSTKMRTYIATIGPTTRQHLRDEFGFEADVCAATPTPEGLENALVEFMQRIGI